MNRPLVLPPVKVVVWDLDDTLWDGVVLEGDAPAPFPAAVATLHTLDRRGVLHAVASRGEAAVAERHLAEHGLAELFVAVEVGWGAKSDAVARVARELNIAADAVAFIDNDPLERAEVATGLPGVRTYLATDAAGLPERPEFAATHTTAESAGRRQLYRTERDRRRAEAGHTGPPAEFLAGLDLELTVRRAEESDLDRAHELTVRTHQLNTTGRTFSAEQLRALCADPGYEVLVADLRDRFGSYGTIGLAVTAVTATTTTLELLLMSCRVMSRGAGAALVDHIAATALAAGRTPMAEFVPTDVNRIMLVTLRFAGFRPVGGPGGPLAVDPAAPPAPRRHPVRVVVPAGRP
ncbi:HAD-IIIC family phosphatase [Actinokineospora guangxiensis]|uniref:HAD-IIIC family phosphatase n=1 Tax=Actinokineospora guangxiensis TaxID=1490288 RepID=A0ABW0EK03_9PSEU